MPQTILMITVGGSHEPIVKAIERTRPDFVAFVCTGDDPATGKPGSVQQIRGKGAVIKAQLGDDRPSLPNIPTQTGLTDEQCEVLLVPADDLDGIVRETSKRLEQIEREHAGGHIVADYTGGTKSMSAGLVTAALASERVTLQLVTGARADLIKVRSGMEHATRASAEGVRLRQAIKRYLTAWQGYAYGAAHKGLSELESPAGIAVRPSLDAARDLSAAFDAWDRFDFERARDLLNLYASRYGTQSAGYLKTLKWLVTDSRRQTPFRLFDLWHNARRRAAQQRFDDAVGRWYRLLEWTAQWLLRLHCDLDTSNLPRESIPQSIVIHANRDGKYQAGLFQAWKLLAELTDGPASEFSKAQQRTIENHVRIRNYSIFAHGDRPIREVDWRPIEAWTEQALLPFLDQQAGTQGVDRHPPQLPTCWNFDAPGTA